MSISVIRPNQLWKGAELFCTTRTGGVGQAPYDNLNLGLGAGEEVSTVLQNRKLLRALLPSEPCWLKQVHGTQVIDADHPERREPKQMPLEADASVTETPGRVLAILTADCLPVVLGDVDGRVLGVAHAGWRGLAAGVLEATLGSLQLKHPGARSWQAWIGPGIGPGSFQVGEDVRVAFEGNGAEQPGMFVPDTSAPGKWLADLAGLAAWRLRQIGVEHIENSGLCTVSDRDKRFFSYRRDRQTGRMATVAWLTDPKVI